MWQSEGQSLQGCGNEPIDGEVRDHSIGSGANARASCHVELHLAVGPPLFGAAIDSNIVTASLEAGLSAVNRQLSLAP